MNEILILGLKTYNFNDSNGNNIQGAKITYLTSNPSTKNNEIGYLPIQASVSLDLVSQITNIPGLYDCKYNLIPGKNNHPTVILNGFTFKKSVDLQNIFKK